nr:hypothetical protein [uncultured Carboxylicivirga sp.]
MEKQGKMSLNKIMRALHRDIGFLVIGMTLIYAISGVVLIYRDTNFLKSEKVIEKQLEPGISESDLGRELHMRRFKVDKTEGDIIVFNGDGTYNKSTGQATYSENSLPGWINTLNGFHKTSSKSIVHWFGLIYGICLFFLAISSFWMFKVSSRLFKRGMIFTAVGLVIAVVLLFV